jgi:DNA-binding NarL/FixJ family response regulator
VSAFRNQPQSVARTLEGPVSTFVVAGEGVAAGVIISALTREGLNLQASWGTLADLTSRRDDNLALVIILEPENDGRSASDYLRIHDAAPQAAIALICSADREQPQSLLWSGADAIIFEPGADAVVGPAVRALLAGYIVVPSALRAALQPPPLTRRERQMLELVVEGLTNREIAARLYLAESTVKRHLSSTFRRMGVSSRREAAAAVLAAEQRGAAHDSE